MAGEKPSRIGRGPGVKSECWLRSSQSAGGSRPGPDPRCGPPADPASVRGFGPRLLPAPRRRREGFALLCRCHDDVSELPSSTTESAWLRGFYFFLFLPSFPLPSAVVKRERRREPLGAPRLLSCWIPGGVQLPLQSSQPLLTHCALAGWSILASCSASSAEQGSNWNSSSNGGPSSFFCDPERRLSE